MSLARRVRAGIALHAGVNVAFALGAVLSAAGGPAAVASGEATGPVPTGVPGGLPVHAVVTTVAHPLEVAPPTTAPPAPPGTAPAAPEPPATAATAATSPPTTAAVRRVSSSSSASSSSASSSASRAGPAPGTVRHVSSTGYCLSGTTASGRPVAHGTAAMNNVPLGTRWRISGGPLDGHVLEVIDRIGHGTDFDIWFPSCAQAIEYGRRAVTVELVG